MIVEGIGKKAPGRYSIPMDEGELRAMLDEATAQATKNGYSVNRGTWSGGCKGELVLPHVGTIPREIRPVFIGKLGEYGLCTFLNIRLGTNLAKRDDRLLVNGDDGIDVTCLGVRIQMKTRQRDSGDNLVKVADKRCAAYFVFGECSDSCLAVKLLGWCHPAVVYGAPKKPSPVGSWTNWNVPDNELEPITSLVDLLTARKESGLWR